MPQIKAAPGYQVFTTAIQFKQVAGTAQKP